MAQNSPGGQSIRTGVGFSNSRGADGSRRSRQRLSHRSSTAAPPPQKAAPPPAGSGRFAMSVSRRGMAGHEGSTAVASAPACPPESRRGTSPRRGAGCPCSCVAGRSASPRAACAIRGWAARRESPQRGCEDWSGRTLSTRRDQLERDAPVLNPFPRNRGAREENPSAESHKHARGRMMSRSWTDGDARIPQINHKSKSRKVRRVESDHSGKCAPPA